MCITGLHHRQVKSLSEGSLIETLHDDDVIQLYTSGTTGKPKGVQ